MVFPEILTINHLFRKWCGSLSPTKACRLRDPIFIMSQKIWLLVSLSSCLGKKKKVKVVLEDEDFEAAFNSLKETCKKQLEPHIRSGTDLPELVMVYKPEDDLEGDDVNLDDETDFEGMLDEYPQGKGVRIIINTEGKDSFPALLNYQLCFCREPCGASYL